MRPTINKLILYNLLGRLKSGDITCRTKTRVNKINQQIVRINQAKSGQIGVYGLLWASNHARVSGADGKERMVCPAGPWCLEELHPTAHCAGAP